MAVTSSTANLRTLSHYNTNREDSQIKTATTPTQSTSMVFGAQVHLHHVCAIQQVEATHTEREASR